jgi:hypothetical protein
MTGGRGGTIGAALVVLALACSRSSSPLVPLRTTVILTSPSAARHTAPAMRAMFNAWIAKAVREPGAEYAINVAGLDRHRGMTVFEAITPQSWSGGDALTAKATWIRTSRAAYASAEQSTFTQATAAQWNIDAQPGVIVVEPPLDSRGEPWRFQARSPRYDAVVCDRSRSSDSECDSESLLHVFDAWMSEGLTPGSSFEIWRVGTSLSTARRIFIVTTPTLAEHAKLTYLFGARNEIAGVISDQRTYGSAIAETVSIAVQSLRDKRDGSRRLWILSDGRQLSTFDFQGRGIPSSAAFVAWLKDNRLAPQCNDIDVAICGIHNRVAPGAPALPPQRFAALRDVWAAAFAAMDARSVTFCGACDVSTFQSKRRD